ncbi:uncharacterized protein LOC124948498 [Vespa velutina]|uniref:uncharacterized protein LOC124948498 n=1 Tax=Vespa velutina TaxID=202808 RepID=UPI001FB3F5F0|nr:uncharacterized protein LOC124948498 [Vespa velutina]
MFLEDIHKYPGLFQNYRKGPTITTTTELTKINIITITLSEYTQNAVDISLVTLGASLNLSIIFIVALNSSLRVSTNCYIISLVASNLVIMIEPSRRILRSIFELNIPMNLDYVFHVSFYSSVLTIVIFSIENYICICERQTSIYENFTKLSNTTKRIVFIWLTSIMITAMELHLYDHFERDDMHDIFAASTIMFMVLPFLILILIYCAIIYELLSIKSIEGQWRPKDLENFHLSIRLSWVFFFTMIPYRIAKVITALNPNAKWCCSTKQMEIFYLLIKIFPIVSTIVCYVTYEKFRKAICFKIRANNETIN